MCYMPCGQVQHRLLGPLLPGPGILVVAGVMALVLHTTSSAEDLGCVKPVTMRHCGHIHSSYCTFDYFRWFHSSFLRCLDWLCMSVFSKPTEQKGVFHSSCIHS